MTKSQSKLVSRDCDVLQLRQNEGKHPILN